MDQKKKNKQLKQKWKLGNFELWDVFRPDGFEDVIFCKIIELREAKTLKDKIDECNDLMRYAEKYLLELKRGKWEIGR